MFMRSQMEKRNTPAGMMVARTPKLEWKVDAVVADDSKKFAEELQALLNAGSEEGYLLSHLMPRDTDNGIVVIHQRHLVEAPGEPIPTAMGKGEN